jgi:ATP-dependent Clp protease ATP-binding subunit ClpA
MKQPQPERSSTSESDEAKAAQQKYMEIENHLRKRIIGQDEPVTAVAQAIRKARVGLKNPRRPVGTLFS